jgi:hypothetical protein
MKRFWKILVLRTSPKNWCKRRLLIEFLMSRKTGRKTVPVQNLFRYIRFSNFSCMFINPNIFFSSLNSNCTYLFDMRNLQEEVKKLFCYQKLFWPFSVWINCSSDLKNFANSWPSASNFKSFSRPIEQEKMQYISILFIPEFFFCPWKNRWSSFICSK